MSSEAVSVSAEGGAVGAVSVLSEEEQARIAETARFGKSAATRRDFQNRHVISHYEFALYVVLIAYWCAGASQGLHVHQVAGEPKSRVV